MSYISGAKVVMLKGEKGDTGYPTDNQVKAQVTEWIEAHPEATIDENVIKQTTREVVNEPAYKDELYAEVLAQAPNVAEYTAFKEEVNTEIQAIDSAVKTVNVYVGNDKKIHFTDSEGADSVLPFSSAPKLIWTNPSSTETSIKHFGKQKIKVEITDNYDYAIIAHRSYNYEAITHYSLIPMNTSSELLSVGLVGQYSYRRVNIQLANGLFSADFENANYYRDDSANTRNNDCVPLRIYGLSKLGD